MTSSHFPMLRARPTSPESCWSFFQGVSNSGRRARHDAVVEVEEDEDEAQLFALVAVPAQGLKFLRQRVKSQSQEERT